MTMEPFFTSASRQHIQKERLKARRLRQTQWWKQKLNLGVCYFCEQKTKASHLTMDHLVPLARMGKTTKNNVVCCCKTCNSKKKHKDLIDIRISKE